MMVRILLLTAAALFGQEETTSNKSLLTSAPPDVEKALRERVSAFYQCYVDGKFRQAEQFVSEDTKDLHYQQEKNKIRSHRILKIVFDDSFKKARVATIVGTTVGLRGIRHDVEAPMSSTWRLEDGKWMYYFNPNEGVDTPVGRMRPGPMGENNVNPNNRLPIGEAIKNPGAIFRQMKVSKNSVLLKSYEDSTDAITIENNMPGPLSVDFSGESLPGLTWAFDRKELKQGEKAVLTFTYKAPDKRAKPTLTGALRLEPFAQSIPVSIAFDIPDEVKKVIPAAPKP
jgi:hypothetical protein